MIIAVQLETWSGSLVVRTVGRSYQRRPAAAFADAPAGLTHRQAVFYRNLIRIAEAVGSAEIPVDFNLPTGERLHLDRGCMKIAELAGFIEPLRDDSEGVVSSIRLSWTC